MAASGLSCSSKFAKYFLFLFNVVFWVAGGVVLGVGIWVLADPNATKILHIATLDSDGGLVTAAAATLVVVGAIIFLTGFLGCCGAIRENSCMLLMYASIVGFVLILQVIAGILAAIFRDTIQEELGNSLNKTVQERYGMDDKKATEGMDIMQRTFKCCGAVKGPKEWQTSKWFSSDPNPVPLTCCVLKNQDKLNEDPIAVNETICYKLAEGTPPNSTIAAEYIFEQGCQPKLHDWIHDHSAILIGVAFGLAAVQLLGIILACCLIKNINNAYEYV